MSGYVISEITLDVAGKSNRYGTVRAKQGDNLTRKIHARITNNGVDYPIASGSSVMVNFHRYDSKTRSYDCTLEDDGTITFPLPYWVLELPYMVTCDVAIIERFQDGTTRKLTTFNFYINVEAASMSDSDVQADETTSFLLRLMDEVEDLRNDYVGYFENDLADVHPSINLKNRYHYCYSGGILSCNINIPAEAEQGWVADVALKIGAYNVPIIITNHSRFSTKIIKYANEVDSYSAPPNKIVHLYFTIDGIVTQCVVEEISL